MSASLTQAETLDYLKAAYTAANTHILTADTYIAAAWDDYDLNDLD
ncbi:unnamed protein product, partial [marine sediment metagenome]